MKAYSTTMTGSGILKWFQKTEVTMSRMSRLARTRADTDVCDQCLCAPCVTDETNRQSWWPSENPSARQTNSIKRKILYKKFWTMLCNRGIFQTQTDRKSEAISRDRQRNSFMWHQRGTQRDILPNCVIQQVREWFQNPPSVSYVGHFWF